MDKSSDTTTAVNNPFAALLIENTETEEETSSSPKQNHSCNYLEKIFSFTLNKELAVAENLLFLEDTSNDLQVIELNLENIDQVLFERILICNSNTPPVLPNQKLTTTNPHAINVDVISYLFNCFKNATEYKNLEVDIRNTIKDKIIQHSSTSIIQPDIFTNQVLEQQMVNILKEDDSCQNDYFLNIVKRILNDQGDDQGNIILTDFIHKMNYKITNELREASLTLFNYNIFNYLHIFTSDNFLGNIFIDSCIPTKQHIGSEYANTPIGVLLNISVLPKIGDKNFEYFTTYMDFDTHAALTNTEAFLWSSLDKLNGCIHSFILKLLRLDGSIRNKLLSWFGECLKYNSDRGKIWNAQQLAEMNPSTSTNLLTVSDGFMLNFSNLLLRLCRPFCADFNDKKILKVDPTYPAVPNDKIESKGIHMYDLSSETCCIPAEGSDDLEEMREKVDKYTFITECFFMAHKSIDLGYKVITDRFMKIAHELTRLDRSYTEVFEQEGANSMAAKSVNDLLNKQKTKFFSYKCVLSEPKFLVDMFDFISSTAYWMCQVAVKYTLPENCNRSYIPLEETPIKFPMSQHVPNTLKCIPEFLIENIVSYLVYLQRFSPKTFETIDYNKLEPILTFILIFMGSENYLKNPHVRARLAEGLHSLIPQENEYPLQVFQPYQRKSLFTSHPHRSEIVVNLMRVFVGIEMTGQSVEFEQKFNYRRPMYAILEYLWNIPEHSECFKRLAREAEDNMEAVEPPLFLRFANLLINDAIFLLDEALTNMAKIKEMETAQENGEWARLNFQERAQNFSYLHHIKELARFNNILGKDTTKMLDRLTSAITIVFTHPTMVDRIASMLNYFLLHLVGPNKKNFKVKNSKEYHFDPADTVKTICKIYVNLKDSDAFCLAVSQDGRSYSPNLFELAEVVLVRIGGLTLIGELKEVAEKVAIKAQQYKANEEAMSDAPEHFLDPIMSTVMVDPIILPSSKQIVDRTTIARHLLSDQTDPFNRSPLSMDQVIPHHELKAEIEAWMKECQNKRNGEGV